MACPASQAGSDEHEDVLDSCWNTSHLVNQLAATLKSLEADVDSLRKENQQLRILSGRQGSATVATSSSSTGAARPRQPPSPPHFGSWEEPPIWALEQALELDEPLDGVQKLQGCSSLEEAVQSLNTGALHCADDVC
jgi:hypothetical protein